MSNSVPTAVQFVKRRLSSVVACTLSRDEFAAQGERWGRVRAEAARECVEPDGVRLTFRDVPWVEEELRALVAVENRCCAWARWEVRQQDGELMLHVTSTGEGISILHTMLTDGMAPVQLHR